VLPFPNIGALISVTCARNGFLFSCYTYRLILFFSEMIKKELGELERFELVKLVNDYDTKQTPFGRIMARHYVSFGTMKIFLGVRSVLSKTTKLNG